MWLNTAACDSNADPDTANKACAAASRACTPHTAL